MGQRKCDAPANISASIIALKVCEALAEREIIANASL
jgi:hypothetical protein